MDNDIHKRVRGVSTKLAEELSGAIQWYMPENSANVPADFSTASYGSSSRPVVQETPSNVEPRKEQQESGRIGPFSNVSDPAEGITGTLHRSQDVVVEHASHNAQGLSP